MTVQDHLVQRRRSYSDLARLTALAQNGELQTAAVFPPVMICHQLTDHHPGPDTH